MSREATTEGPSSVPEKTSTNHQHNCEHCSKKFWQASTLRDHVDFFHLGLKKYVCGDCGKALETKARLRWHIANDRKCVGSKNNIEQLESKAKVTAAAQDKYTCPQCGKKFWQNSTLRDHIDFVHKGLKKYQCQQCSRAFETKARLKGHCDATGNCAQVKEKIFQCPKCQKAFLKQDGLAKHAAKCL